MSDDALRSLAAGGAAGTCVDLVFFPIDTLKTRLQARGGFLANGGWRGVYQGVGSTIVASAPGAAVFFVCYDQGKKMLPSLSPSKFKENSPLTHMTAGALGEIAACSIRVPSEVVKQRVQTGQYGRSRHAFVAILRNVSGEGAFRGLYRGYLSTIMREIPFTAIQFPLYEKLKKVTPVTDAAKGLVCGPIAGAVAAALTTPLDVIKTRLMLHHEKISVARVMSGVWHERAFFKGVVPRTLWISAGGSVFLGMYELTRTLMGAVETKA